MCGPGGTKQHETAPWPFHGRSMTVTLEVKMIVRSHEFSPERSARCVKVRSTNSITSRACISPSVACQTLRVTEDLKEPIGFHTW